MNQIAPTHPIHIWSDLHLEHPECDMPGIWRAQVAADKVGAKVICVGDLVDLWYASRRSIGLDSLGVIHWMRDRLIMNVPGNHDSPTVHNPLLEPQEYPYSQLEIDARLWHIEHGHLIGKWAWLFKLLDEWDGKTWFRKIARVAVNTEKVMRLGSSSSDPEYKYNAIDRAKLKGATVVVVGHNHFAEIYRDHTGEAEVTYVNPGCALRKMTYAVYKNGNFKLENA